MGEGFVCTFGGWALSEDQRDAHPGNFMESFDSFECFIYLLFTLLLMLFM